MEKQHKALKRYNDQYFCSDCGKQWDIDDEYPPECEKEKEKGLIN
jgi:hypothetical protein